MPRIKQLSLHEAQKIAAGEVVERPANVVKELIENSIDAGATAITIWLEQAGKQLIRVSDNGSGMDPEDARLCFKHHATSKINSVHDLEFIHTFGFRGEALSSIASVSNITLITKEELADQATRLTLEKGDIISEELVTATTGTDIFIHDLFYNIPARRKFLKTHDTEWRQVVQLFHAFALDYTHIHFKLIHDHKEYANCPSTETIQDRLAQLKDHTLTQNMISFETTNNEKTVHITGIISNQQYFRYDRSSIYFFVNKRWVKNYKLGTALTKGYLNVIPQGRYPAAFVFITIEPSLVDINIHPRKEEVQFAHPRTIEQLIQKTVNLTLADHLSQQLAPQKSVAHSLDFLSSSTTPGTTKENIPFSATFSGQEQLYNTTINTGPRDIFQDLPFKATNTISSTKEDIRQDAPIYNSSQATHKNRSPIYTPTESHQHSAEQQTNYFDTQFNTQFNTQSVSSPHNYNTRNYSIIGNLNKTYILLEREDGLFIVDQHAAHERVLYEIFSQRFSDIPTIPLLFPHTITLSNQEVSLIEQHKELFTRNNIGLDIFSEKQILITSTPVHIKHIDFTDFIKHILSLITEHSDIENKQLSVLLNEKLHAQMACKAAVKAGDLLSHDQMEKLLNDLHATDNRFTCPHGRPTGWLVSSYEIEKKFKRKA